MGRCIVAVDRAQPVAASVSPDGEVLDVASWAHEVAPPTEAAHPNRRIGVGDGRLVVQDLPGCRPVSLAVGADGTFAAEPVTDSPAGAGTAACARPTFSAGCRPT